MPDSLERLRNGDLDLAPSQPKRPLPAPIRSEEDLALWREELTEANADVDQWARERARTLARASVEEIQRLDALAATAQVRADRAAAIIERGEARFADLAERDRAAQPERRRKHKAALEARAEAERILVEVYGPAADMVVQALTKLGELETIIRAASVPPDGERQVLSYEAFRHPPEAHCLAIIPLATAVQLPPVVRSQPDFWPRRS